MAIIRENGRSGAALCALLLAGCLAKEGPLFETVAAPELRADPVENPALGSTPAADLPTPERVAEQAPLPQSLTLPVAPPAVEPPLLPGTPAPMQLPPPDPPPPPSDPCAAGGLLLCDTFENDSAGSFPSAQPWLDELSSCGTHRVDESGVSRSGSRALLALAGGYPECMLHADLSDEEDIYVRSWVRLGAEPELLDQYLSLLELGTRAGQDEPELRIGLRPSGGSLCGSEPGLDASISGIASGSSTECSGFALEPQRWYCLQVHLSRSGRRLDYSLGVDDTQLLTQADVRLGPSWNDDGLFLKLGRAAYGQSAAGSVWQDDVAVSREPLPCTL